MSASAPRGPCAGFTLIEVLIAIAILAFLTLALSRGLAFGVVSLERIEASAKELKEQRLAYGLVRELLSRALPLPSRPPAQPVVAFTGNEASLAFAAPGSTPSGLEGVYLVNLRLVGTDAERSLVVERCLASGEGAAVRCVGHSERIATLHGVAALHASYYGALGPFEAPAWRNDWAKATALPRLVRFNLERAGGRAALPELVVVPMTAARVR